jgi:ATP-dependent Clp protease ATP-binding subunit ClpA
MDHGKLTDNNGKVVDFRNVVLIMTTNAGAQELSKSAIGFNRTHNEGADIEAIEKMFTPEFRNRLDAIIPFAPLGKDVIRLVVDKFIMQLDAQLADRNVEIELSEAAMDWLAERGYDAKYGARPLARVVQEYIKKPLADEMLFGGLVGGGFVFVDVADDDLTVSVKAPPQKAISSGNKRAALPAPYDS